MEYTTYRNHTPIMESNTTPYPLLMLYNLDQAWSDVAQRDVVSMVISLASALSSLGHRVRQICLMDQDLRKVLEGVSPQEWIVLNWCEEIPGLPHSCAEVAQVLEETGFTFTGASSQALRFSLDKPAVKRRLHSLGIPTPPWKVVHQPGEINWKHFPAIIKPAYEHCSLGITVNSVVNDQDELSAQVESIIKEFQQPALVEHFLPGREFHVSIVGNGHLQVFPIAEMDYQAIPEQNHRLCTYDSKFSPSSTDYQNIQLKLPAELSENEKRLLEETAIAAYQACRCRDYARLDIRQGEESFYVLDVNPNADLSPDTSLAISAGTAGLAYGELMSLLVNLAAKRHLGIKAS